VAHPARRTWTELTEKCRKSSREAFAASLERRHGRVSWLGRCFLVLPSPFAHWAVFLRSPKLQDAPQRLSAIAILFRIRFWRFLECQRLLLVERGSVKQMRNREVIQVRIGRGQTPSSLLGMAPMTDRLQGRRTFLPATAQL
jgi:hypothetical protein